MKGIVWLLNALFILAGASSLSAADNAGPVPPPDGSVVLWNGHDLTGWTVVLKDPKADPATAWSAADGIIHVTGKAIGYLRTEKIFSNYHLHVEWRWPQKTANSGVFVHLNGPDKIWPNAVQCQVKGEFTGDLLGMSGFDFKPSVPSKGNNVSAKIAAPSEKPAGEWNTYEIFCRADTIEVFVNGVHENHVEKLTSVSGFVALQMEGFPIDFRNVWLQPL